MKAQIVIDTSFGDGGKGLTVDNLCRQAVRRGESVAVVRFSGGQQCGHTVIRDGVKHVFSTYGSGTLQCIPTYYTEHATMSLQATMTEYFALREKGIEPKLYFHPQTRLTTPYDVAYNRAKESAAYSGGRAGDVRHGSCGMGVGATLKRHDETPYKIYASDLLYPQLLSQKLDSIKMYYARKVHSEALNDSDGLGYGQSFYSAFHSEVNEQLESFEAALELSKQHAAFEIANLYPNQFRNLIYEGSQGVLLDMDHGIFPNVTYGNTTCKNAIEHASCLGIRDIELFYVSRCYLTRHGRGWMPNETPVTLVNTDEEINVTNPWQEHLRIGELDYDLINYALNVDAGYHRDSYRRNMVITCLDQRPDWKLDTTRLPYYIQGVYTNASPQADSWVLTK